MLKYTDKKHSKKILASLFKKVHFGLDLAVVNGTNLAHTEATYYD